MDRRGYKDLKVYQLAYSAALEIFHETKNFPKEERYDLTPQLRRSSRSVPRNLAEAWRRRVYPKVFFQKIVDCSAEASETEVSLDMAFDCGYLSKDRHEYFMNKYDEINRMLTGMLNKPDRFTNSRFPQTSPPSEKHPSP